MKDLPQSLQVIIQGVAKSPPSVPLRSLALIFVIAELDRELANEAALQSLPDPRTRLALRREMLAVYVGLIVLTASGALPNEQFVELGKKVRLSLDHFASYAAEINGSGRQTNDQNRAAAYRTVVGLSQIEPAARDFARLDERLHDLPFD